MNKIQQKAEDRLVDEISTQLANQAIKPIDAFMDSLFAASYEQETGERYNPEDNARMAEYINGMLGEATLSDSYSFNYILSVETTDFGSKETNDMTLLISTESDIFGLEQEDDGKKMRIVFDNENKTMASYDLEKNEVFAFPLNPYMVSAFSQMGNEELADKYKIDVTKLNKSKKILGYHSEAYKIESEESQSDVYISTEVPFTWEESFGTMMRQFAANFYRENEDFIIDGMLMEAKTIRKSDEKSSIWKTKKIENATLKIDNSSYQRSQYGQ